MRESDSPELLRIAREVDADPVLSRNAALCGARRVSSRQPSAAQMQAGQEDEGESTGALSVRQSRAAQMLAGGMNVIEVAAVLGIHRGTIFRWRANHPEFLAEQQRCAARAATELSLLSRRLLVKAVGYVERVMEEDTARDDWAARILRNRQLWLTARSEPAATDC